MLNAVLAKNKYTVKALIRKSSNASKIEALGVEVLRGDMMDPPSLKAACKGVDVVICTANGYMSGHPEIDTEGVNNVVDAIKVSPSVKRYIYCSVLTADLAKSVDHFYCKYEHEEYIKKQGVPYIALRPGAFLDQVDDYLGDGIKRGDSFAVSVWNKTVPIGMIYTPDLAKLFADAIELPEEANGQHIDVGWSRPIAYQEVVSICSRKLNRRMMCITFPWLLRMSAIYTVGCYSNFWKEMFLMFNYFGFGKYVNNTDLQRKYFGEPPSPEEVIGRYVDGLLDSKTANPK